MRPPQENEKEIRAAACAHRRRTGQDLQLQGPSAGAQARSRPRHEGRREEGRGGRRQVGKTINGWQVSALPGDSAHYNGDWLKRAAAAKAGIYGNDAAEATYPLTRVDGDGQTLDGSKHNYTLTFPPGQQPPVNAFWSVTMYDGKTQLLIENPINRYLVNSPMLPDMKKNAGRLVDAVHPEQIAGRRQGIQLAAGAERPDLSGDAAVLAEDRSAVDPAAGRRHLEAAGDPVAAN